MLKDSQRLIIVGASLAGLRATQSARSAGFAGELVLIGDEIHPPYDRPPLSKAFLGEDTEISFFHDAQYYETELGVRVMLGHPASALDLDGRQVIVDGEKLGFDRIILATGAAPRRLADYEGIDGVRYLRSADDAVAIRNGLEKGERLTILGAGFIGAEVASAARLRDGQVTIVEASEYPLERALGKTMGTVVSRLHRENGVDLRTGVTLAEVSEEGGKVTSVTLSDGSVVPTDMLLISIGALPATSWLASSGLAMNQDGSIVCDEYLESSAPGVFAAGDIVSWHNRLSGTRMRLEHWTSANEQGAIAGHNAVCAIEDRKAYETVPYFWSDWYKNRIQFVGRLGSEEPQVVWGDPAIGEFVALYRDGEQLVGSLAVNQPGKIMKDRLRIARGTRWDEALAHYRELPPPVRKVP